MKVDNIYELVERMSKYDISSFEYEQDGSRLSVNFAGKIDENTINNWNNQFAANKSTLSNEENIAKATSTEVSSKSTEKQEESEPIIEGNIIKSPIVGTFYAAAEDGSEPFVKEGQKIKKGDIVAIIEAMKLMNEIKSEFDGTVKKVFVTNGQIIQYGDPLFEIV